MAALITVALGTEKPVHATVIVDLTNDWSNASNPNATNPNGTWQYRSGTTDPPLFADWQSLCGGSPAQPAWAPSNTDHNYLPALFQAACTPSSAFSSGIDAANWAKGDIIDHTVDPFNGVGNGVANYLFTSNVGGSFNISGTVWDARHISRPQGWSLLVNGISMASGSMDGNVSKSSPNTFSVNFLFNPGTMVELDEFRNGTAGDFVGSTLTIAGTPSVVPEPGSIMLMGTGLAALWVRARRGSRGYRGTSVRPPESLGPAQSQGPELSGRMR
jgi:hypothetical protein